MLRLSSKSKLTFATSPTWLINLCLNEGLILDRTSAGCLLNYNIIMLHSLNVALNQYAADAVYSHMWRLYRGEKECVISE